MLRRTRQISTRSAFTAAAAALLTLGAAGVAAAQEVSAEIGLASEYVGKGAGKSDGQPAVNGTIGVSFGQVYGEVFASTADLSSGADSEIIATVGWVTEAVGFEWDLSAQHRELPGSRPGFDDSYQEYQVDVSRALGPVGTRFRVNYTPDGSGGTREAWWVELQGGVALDARTRATAAIAERTARGGADYVAWNIGAKRKLTDQIALDVRWYDTDSHEIGETHEGRLVGALTYAF